MDDFDPDQDYESFYKADFHQIGVWLPMVRSHAAYIDNKLLVIELDGVLIEGTDTACHLFGQMMKHLTRDGWLVLIINDGWIPSPERLIDHELAKKLAIGY